MINWLLFTWLLYPIGEAVVQGLLFKYKKNFGHVPGDAFYLILFFIRGIAAILHGGLVVDAQPGVFIPLFSYYAATHWLLFDVTLNKMRGKDIDYEGENSGWLKDVPFKTQMIIAAAITATALVYLYKLGYLWI